jgi:class 3 adenylate cyclase
MTPSASAGAAAAGLPSDCQPVTVGIAFFDLSRLAQWASENDDEQVAAFLQSFYRLAGESLGPAGIRIVKFMGDAGLCVFPTERADAAVAALCDFAAAARQLAGTFGYDCYLNVNVHAGEVLQGTFGTADCACLDVIGKAVNVAARLGRRGVTLSAQAFRLLSAEERESFQKLKPPISYRYRGGPDA